MHALDILGDPVRRRILELLAAGERSVNDIAHALDLNQPQASKHLKVLKEVGLVGVRGAGKRRLYTLNAEKLRPVFDWVRPFERLWVERLGRLDDLLEDLKKGRQA